MRQKNKQRKNHRWLFVSLSLIIICFIASIIFAVYLYHVIQKDKNVPFTQTEEYVLSNTDLVHIDMIESFYEKDSYHIVFGETEEETQQIIFIPLSGKSDEGEFITIEQNEIISKDELINQLKQDCQNCTIIKVKPAMINENPLWEITYRDHKDRYVFDYFSMDNGSRYERLQFKQLFK